MDFSVKRVNVWAASIPDEPGGLSTILKGLTEAGADLDFVIARRSPEKPGSGVVFLTPIRGDREIAAASLLGFNLTSSVASVRVQGKNVPGAAAALTDAVAETGINIRGFSVAVIGARFIAYLGFDSVADAEKAVEILEGRTVVLATH